MTDKGPWVTPRSFKIAVAIMRHERIHAAFGFPGIYIADFEEWWAWAFGLAATAGSCVDWNEV